METQTLETLSNTYLNDIKELGTKKDLILKRLDINAKNMKDAITQIQLGDDARVDEAIMITFLSSLFNDITKAYQQFKALGYQLKLDKLDEDKASLNTKLENIKHFQEHPERVNRYTQLNIEKTSLENTIKELQEQSIKNINEGIVEISDEDPLGDAQKRLIQVIKEMDEIGDFYGYATDENFMQDLEESEKKWYGESAKYLKAARALDLEPAEELLKASAGLSGMDQEKVAALHQAFKNLEELGSGELNEDLKSELVSQLYHATVGVEAATEVERLAQESTEILKETENDDTNMKHTTQPVQELV